LNPKAVYLISKIYSGGLVELQFTGRSYRLRPAYSTIEVVEDTVVVMGCEFALDGMLVLFF